MYIVHSHYKNYAISYLREEIQLGRKELFCIELHLGIRFIKIGIKIFM